MNGRNLSRAAVALLAPMALLAGVAPTAGADDPDPRGLWSVHIRENTVTLKFTYLTPPDEDYPHNCTAALGTGEVGTAEIFSSNYETLVFSGIADGPNVVTASCEDNDAALRDVGYFSFELPGPPTSTYVGTHHFLLED